MIKTQPWNRWLHRVALHFPLAPLAHQLFGCSHRCSLQPTKTTAFLSRNARCVTPYAFTRRATLSTSSIQM